MRPGRTFKDHRYPVNRSVQRIYRSYQELLKAFATQGRRTEFCEVIDPPDARVGDLSDYPWPTLILGSGCTAIDNQSYLDLEQLAMALEEKVGEFKSGPIGELNKKYARGFLESLYTDRVGRQGPGPRAGSGDPVSVVEVSVSTARLVLTAARLSRFYHLAQAETAVAPSRWDDDVAAGEVGEMTAEDVALRDLITDTIDEFAKLTDIDPTVGELVETLLTTVANGFVGERGKVRRDDLMLVTEVAWHFIIQGTAIYPGWTDLLLSMLLEFGWGDNPSNRRRPAIENLSTAPATVAVLMDGPTKRSWEQRWTSRTGASERERFYDEAAILLRTEANLLQARVTERDLSGGQLPPAAAFVSGFDIELEMSLWKRGVEFTVMVPVHVQENDTDGALAWFAYDVKPQFADSFPQQLDQLRSGGTWRVAERKLDEHQKTRPYVVRLSGSPLLVLPTEIDQEMKRALGYGPAKSLTISHAVVLDEYTALQVSLSDLAGSIPQADSKVVLRSLPLELANHPDYSPRYWLSFGVQISDSAIRFRLFAQLSRRDLDERDYDDELDSDSDGDKGSGAVDAMFGPTDSEVHAGTEAPSVVMRSARRPRGLAVNTRIDHDEAMLLYWLGFNILQTDSAELIDALKHCSSHLENPSLRPSRTAGCPLPRGDG